MHLPSVGVPLGVDGTRVPPEVPTEGGIGLEELDPPPAPPPAPPPGMEGMASDPGPDATLPPAVDVAAR